MSQVYTNSAPPSFVTSNGSFYSGTGNCRYNYDMEVLYSNRTNLPINQKWYKCPFCGRRQNIDVDGGMCLSCNGDVMYNPYGV